MKNGIIWQDIDGNDIQAHGGCILCCDGTYYWYGESYGYVGNEKNQSNLGVACYSSKDLKNWIYEGMSLNVFTDRQWFEHDLYYKNVIQRPKVIYNSKTRKFMMYFHLDNPVYTRGAVGIASSDTPTGEFYYIGAICPNFRHSHDMTVFADDNGETYLFSSSDHNASLRVIKMAEDGLGFYNYSIVVSEKAGVATREAPVVFKLGGKYYLITSGCSGWSPNRAKLMVADSIMGEWTDLGDPCIGENSETTFMSQGAFSFRRGDEIIFAADRWMPLELNKSGYVWLKIVFENGVPTLCWQDEWR